MSADGLTQPAKPQGSTDKVKTDHATNGHPAGPVRHGPLMQAFLMTVFFFYMNISCLAIHAAQLVLAPLYWVDKDYFYAWMAFTKQLFGILATTITHWFSPTVIRLSGDAGVADQMRIDANGKLRTSMPERLVLIANHQIYNDWLYLWWMSYTSGMHGHIFIILKESLKYVPVVGPGMMFWGFIFLARNWAKDQARFKHRLQQLKTKHAGPLSGQSFMDPMWLLIFPEGTNLSLNGRRNSAKWAEKSGQQDLRHQLLPRSTGLHFCLTELKGTVEWVYDCTIAYEGIPRGQYGQDLYTLRSMYFQGRAPKSVNMYWRRFAVSSIPLHDSKEFEQWVRQRWIEKDQLLEQYAQTGRFPASKSADPETTPFIETRVQQQRPYEFLMMYVPAGLVLLLWALFYRLLK